MKKLTIEKATAADDNIKMLFNNYKINSPEFIVNVFKKYLPQLKVGRGGSHIWISTNEGERLAIIYF